MQELIEVYAGNHIKEAEDLLLTLARIPAPTRKEDKRAAFVKEFLTANGAKGVKTDRMKNVIWECPGRDPDHCIVLMAHMDVVFDDEDELPLTIDGDIVRCPGVGDDTANLVNLLMSAKFLLDTGLVPEKTLVFVANSCEEGLGNSDGCRAVCEAYGDRMDAFYSYDGNLGMCCGRAVGSYRYEITAKVTGGHSYTDFGNDNAIVLMAELIGKLEALKLPRDILTTRNAGVIEGGTTVNSIAASCRMLYEFRSESQKNLEIMDAALYAVLESMPKKDAFTVKVIGRRPGSSPENAAAREAFSERSREIIRSVFDGELDEAAYSTDSNIPLSMGIPANTIGTIDGALAHTRQEWIRLPSLAEGLAIALKIVESYL